MTTQTQTRPVASRAPANAGSAERVDFHYHPRLIRALGAELVTSDIVAIIELVKNSYDAFAHNVTIRFAEDAQGEYIEIEDDGLGMTRDVIMNAWFTVATPHKVSNPTTRFGARQRRVSGDKGLGRLSAARLGGRLEMITKTKGDPCWKVDVRWDASSSEDETSGRTAATISEIDAASDIRKHGTRIRIYDLGRGWSDPSFVELRDSLARLLSPFKTNDVFNITLFTNSSLLPEEIAVEVPEFLSNPPYKVTGSVDSSGNVEAQYRHATGKVQVRQQGIFISWSDTYFSSPELVGRSSPRRSQCGAFSFEIRAWDLNPDERRAIANRFHIQAREIQRAININKGISLYRDGVLVLPKTDHAKDWLGLDTRRIQRVGPRIGTRNVVGYVNIRADANPDIRDTSDRESLMSNIAVDEFRSTLMAIISRFETERNVDRKPIQRMNDVFSGVSAESVLRRARWLESRNEPIAKIVPAITRHAGQMDRTREALRGRLTYYSRVAALGQMAHMLVHEVRNRTTSIGGLLKRVRPPIQQSDDRELSRVYDLAVGSVNALEALADKLAPLASRTFKRSRHCVVEDQMRDCMALLTGPMQSAKVRCDVPETRTHVQVDPGELTHVLLNLLDNAVYWLNRVKRDQRHIKLMIVPNRSASRVLIRVIDNGPGIDRENAEDVFLPGFTLKPHGTGMGLTVASELVSGWGGRMRLVNTDSDSGTTFVFDAPLSDEFK